MRKVIIILGLTTLIIGGIILAKFKLNKKDVIIENEVEKKMNIRQPAVAGTFYPSDRAELKNKINQLLSSVSNQIGNDQIVNLLIVPHAGYEYSGSIAAEGFKQIKNDYDQVFLIGSTHESYFKGIVVDENIAWETPLGQTKINLATAQKIVDSHQNFQFNSKPHRYEHSLEVELPFLQTILDDFQIIPILIGQASNDDIHNLATAIHKYLTPNSIIIISSDLSHYPNYEIANSVDERTIKSILTGDAETFDQIFNHQMAQNYPNLDTCACAEKAIKTGMIVAQEITSKNLQGSEGSFENGDWKLLKYANSGDISGEKGRVVGYAAITFSTMPPEVDTSNQVQKKNY